MTYTFLIMTINTHRDMLKKEVRILCSNLEKRVADMNYTLSLRNRFIIKHIRSNEDKVRIEYIN